MVHLRTIRSAYRSLLADPALRSWLYAQCDPADPPERQKARVDEILTRLRDAIHPDAAPVQVPAHQDQPDSVQHRLTREQAEKLQEAPGYETLRGYRDSALLALLLATGIREGELCALDVEDLRQWLKGELALWVREGKGRKSRLVPYGELSECLIVVDAWLREADICAGAVFRGLDWNGHSVKQTRLTPRAVEHILHDYPVVVDAQEVHVTAHDLRRTYAALQYAGGMTIKAIQENLGHSKMETTLAYIGQVDVAERRARAALRFNLLIPNRQMALPGS
jgi:site-specific recombinase XerD